MDFSVIPECYVDTNLIETLVPTKIGYNHQKGCGTVTKVMKEKLGNGFALGIIDKDKKEVQYLNEFKEEWVKGPLRLHRHKDPQRHHYIIQISPAIEALIMNAAEAAGLSLSDYDLPSTFEAFKKQSKQETSKKDVRFKRLFRDLHAQNVPEIVLLANWVNYLKQMNYKADIEVLKAM